MFPSVYACRSVRTVLDEIGRLKDSDFPYSHSREALERVEDIFRDRLTMLEALTNENDSAVIQVAAAESLLQLFVFLPLLGFVLRSTNVRNSFEIFRSSTSPSSAGSWARNTTNSFIGVEFLATRVQSDFGPSRFCSSWPACLRIW